MYSFCVVFWCIGGCEKRDAQRAEMDEKASLIKMEQSLSRAGQHRTQSERKEWVLLLCVPSRVGLTEILEADRREWSAGSVVMRARVLYDGKV